MTTGQPRPAWATLRIKRPGFADTHAINAARLSSIPLEAAPAAGDPPVPQRRYPGRGAHTYGKRITAGRRVLTHHGWVGLQVDGAYVLYDRPVLQRLAAGLPHLEDEHGFSRLAQGNRAAVPMRGSEQLGVCPSGKRSYANEREALRTLARIWDKDRPEASAYKCPKCPWWHLTKQPQRDEGGEAR